MKPKPFKLIKTERLSLKPWVPSFKMAQYLFDLIERNREHFKYLPMALVKPPEEEYEYLKSAKKKWDAGASASYAIYLRGTKKLIGTCGVHQVSSSNKTGEIGYWLDQDYIGHGYMTEAVKAIENAFFHGV